MSRDHAAAAPVEVPASAAAAAPAFPAAAAEWIRRNAWPDYMRRIYAERPGYYTACACQYTGGSCMAGDKPGRHQRCHLGVPLPLPETTIVGRGQAAAAFAEPYRHPAASATGWHPTRAAQVWLADRVCRWSCPCDCGHPGPEPAHSPCLHPHAQKSRQAAEAVTLPALGADPVWARVMAAAEGRCQCTLCPEHRKHQGFRCETRHQPPGVRLTVAPADPGPDPARRPDRARGELVAWCGPCWERTARATARTYRHLAARRLADQTDPLF